MSRSFRLLFVALGALALGIGLWYLGGPGNGREDAPAVVPVATANAEEAASSALSAPPSNAGGGTSARDVDRREPLGDETVRRELDVRFADGARASGARVVAFRGTRVLFTASTDERGVARLFVPDDACEVAVHVAGAPVHRAPLAAADDTIRLPRGSVLAGWMTVNDGPPGEEVRLTLSDDHGWVPPGFLSDAVWAALGTSRYVDHVTHTTRGGDFRFAGLPAEWRWAELEPPAGFHVLEAADFERGSWPFSKSKIGISRPVDDFHLACTRALRIRGRLVHGDTGEPVAGGRASLGGSFPDGRGAKSTTRTLGDDARFEFALQQPVRLGLTTLEVSSPQGAGEKEIPLDEATPDAQGLWDLGDIPLAPFATLRFLVRDAREHPIEGAVVRAGEEEYQWERRFSDRTDAEGRTSLEVERHLPDVLVVAAHFRPATVPLGPTPPDPIVVTLARATELIVDVNRADGPLPAGLQVRVSCRLPLFPDSGTWIPPLGGTTFGGGSNISVSAGGDGGSLRLATDEEGRLGLSALRTSEPLGIRVRGGCGFVGHEETIPALREGEMRIVEVEVGGLVRAVRGTVLDPDGVPVEGAPLSVLVGEDDDRHVARTDAAGEFAAEGFLPDAITLLVRADGLAPTFVRHRPQPPPGAELVIRLERGTTVRVIVVDAAGRAVAEGEVHASIAGVPGRFDVTGVGPGVYTIDGLPPGTVDLELHLARRVFALAHDTAEPEARFVVPRPSRVVVTVERTVADVVAGDDGQHPFVLLRPRDDEGERIAERLVPAPQWGWAARFAAVLPGEYEVLVHHYSGDPEALAVFGSPVFLTVPPTGETVRATVHP